MTLMGGPMRAAKISTLTFIYCSLLLTSFCPAMPTREVHGRVVDETGAAIVGAQVQLDFGQTVSNLSTDAEGTFLLVASASSGKVRVSAPGFSSAVMEWNQSLSSLTVTLKPAPVSETVVVTGERSPTQMNETAANIVALTPA